VFKISRYKLKSKTNKKIYKGFAIHIYRLKFEMISYGKKRLYRAEWNDWSE